jgi:rubrerythrin
MYLQEKHDSPRLMAERELMLEDITLKGCMEFAVATEELGAKVYSRLATKFGGNKDIAQIFARLAGDEQIHKQQFSELLKKAPADDRVSGSPEKHEYVKAMSISEFFSHHHGPFQDIENIKDRNDALQKALDFEKATLGFYKAVEDVLGTNELLAQVIEVEKNHVVVLMKTLLVEGSEFRSLQDNWP